MVGEPPARPRDRDRRARRLDDALADDVRSRASSPPARRCSEIAVVREPPDVDAPLTEVRAAGERRARAARSSSAARPRRAGRALVRGGAAFDDLRAAAVQPLQRRARRPRRRRHRPPAARRPRAIARRPTRRRARGRADRRDPQRPGSAAARSTASAPSAPSTRPELDRVLHRPRRCRASTTSTSSPGKVALVYALGGAEGDFGVKDTADALLPDLLAPVEPALRRRVAPLMLSGLIVSALVAAVALGPWLADMLRAGPGARPTTPAARSPSRPGRR